MVISMYVCNHIQFFVSQIRSNVQPCVQSIIRFSASLFLFGRPLAYQAPDHITDLRPLVLGPVRPPIHLPLVHSDGRLGRVLHSSLGDSLRA